MSNPIKNLGDYNIARNLVKEAGGSWDIVYNNIVKTAVAKATPKLLLKGGIGGGLIVGLLWGGREVYQFMKNRKELIENEAELKKKFKKLILEQEIDENSDEEQV